jgi:outer membrane protein OmpA-like peptidoglycan-associated protein
MKYIGLILTFFVFQISYAQLTAAKYSIKNISVNTKYSDYGTSYFGPNRIIFASSKKDAKKLRNKFKSNQDNAPKYDLYKGFLNHNGEINYIKKILNNFTTKYNESNVSFTPDLRHVYFTQNNIKKGKYIYDDKDWMNLKIYRADVKTNGNWTNIVSLPFNDDAYSCAHPSVSEDGRILFFTSDMPGSYGQSDIYWVTILKDGKYGTPQNIGSHVNSRYRENFPYVDGNILYYSSDRPGSIGGLDIFMVALDRPDSKPTNLGDNINSRSDDFCFVIDRKHKTGFFSSNRPKGKGKDDIYFFKQETKIKDCKQLISGEIRDKETDKLISGAIVKMYSHDNILLATVPVKKDAKFAFNLACRGNYRLEAEKYDYKKTFRHINFTPNEFNQDLVLYLEKKKKDIVASIDVKKKTDFKKKETKSISQKKINNKPIVQTKVIKKEKQKDHKTTILNTDGKEILNLKPIFFALDEYYITQESYETLAKAARIIKENPDITIEFGAHTDCRASDSYNLHLSALRANEVVKHLVYLGVAKNRIIGRGYGESQLVNKCRDGIKCTEEEHLQNRRTEFVIIKK